MKQLKRNEQEAADALKCYLATFGFKAVWEAVYKDPPDFEFMVEGHGKWAVEVTELQQYCDLNGKPIERATIQESLWNLCKQIKQVVAEDLTQSCTLMIFGPIQFPQKIKKKAIEYVRSGKTEQEILDNQGRATIKCIADPRGPRFVFGVGLSSANPGADGKSLNADIAANLSFAINRILCEKLTKLEALSGFQRRVLLIWNSEFFGDHQIIEQVLAKKSLPLSQVDVIFFVLNGEVSCVANPSNLPLDNRPRRT